MRSEAVGTGRRLLDRGTVVLVWVCGLTTAVWWVGIELEQWSVSYNDQPGELKDVTRRASMALLAGALVAPSGPSR
ncbi:hypothetical protein [Micromonospora sp. NPDC093244]|uniref:hypothetical protein n=1 Tax=Micromonospora sp. NPDC093244 TaxID=3155071 RepID=UPI0034308D48